jgi:hypothetical protein
MDGLTLELPIEKMDPRKGGYFYLRISAELVDQFPQKRATRLICTLDNNVNYRCGLNHLGDGDFFIILSAKRLKLLDKVAGSSILCVLREDPGELGVDVPEVLEALLAQDDELRTRYEQLPDGKKRGLIYSIEKVKGIDRQVKIAVAIINGMPRPQAVRL